MDTEHIVVSTGCEVELELISEDGAERLNLRIVPDEQADYYAGFLGEHTALARAILGQEAGLLFSISAEENLAVRILSISPSQSLPADAKSNAARRQEALDQTRRQIERTNAIIFSTTVEGKWGEYDTDGIEGW